MSEADIVTVWAGDVRGIINGIQSLLQLLPLEKNQHASIQPVEIYDYARFTYRGMQLDGVSHMFSIDFVEKYIDYLAVQKFNTQHWHLTDKQN